MQKFGIRSYPLLSLTLLFFLSFSPGKGGEVIDTVVASVNGKPILLSELQRARSERSVLFSTEITDLSEIREQLIEDILIESYALRQNIRITDEELEREIDNLARQRRLKKDEYMRLVEESGIVQKTYRQFLREQLLRTRLIQREILPWVTVDEADLLAYRKAHPDRFRTPPQVEFNFALLEKEQIAKLFPDCKRPEDCFSRTLPSSLSERLIPYTKKIVVPFDELPQVVQVWVATPIPQGALGLFPDPSGKVRALVFVRRIPPEDLPMGEIRSDLEEAVRREKLELSYQRWLGELKKNAIIERFPIPGS
jgi:peptidyl-prolyl cis-trans isomerase SurA